MKTETPIERLHLMARASAEQAKGNMDVAVERFDRLLTKENDTAIERALCRQWRLIAIRSELASAFTELRAEGRLPRIGSDARIRTTDYDTTRETVRTKSWAAQQQEKIKERIEDERRNYLNEFRVNGEPIGDCTAEVVLAQAERREKDARFMRLVAAGVPPQGKIRDYVTIDEAAERWEMANDPNAQLVDVGGLFKVDANKIPAEVLDAWTMLHKGIKTEDQYQKIVARAKEIAEMSPAPKTWGQTVLDCYVNAAKSWEDQAH